MEDSKYISFISVCVSVLEIWLTQGSNLSFQEGTSNYFKGLMLVLCYIIVAASFFVHVDPHSVGEFSLSCR